MAVYRHNDIDREHFHIVSIRVTENGKRLNQKSRPKGNQHQTFEDEVDRTGLGITVIDHRTKTAYKRGEISRSLNAALFKTREQRWTAGQTAGEPNRKKRMKKKGCSLKW